VRRLLGAGVLLALVAAALAWVIPSDSFLLLPDRAKPLAERVLVEGEQPDPKGGIYYVDVVIRKATYLEELVSAVRPDGADLVPQHAIVPPGSSFEERRRQNALAMQRSQQIAAAVALRAAGKKVVARPDGVLVAAVQPGSPADGKLQPGEVIVRVDGNPVRTPQELRTAIQEHRPGDEVELGVRDGPRIRTVTLRTVESPDEPGRAVVGIQVEQDARIVLPLDVEIDLGSVGGPSAGLAFALDILEELGRNVDHGHKVAATGEIELDGTVAPIGGIKQKTLGARAAGIEVFVVPAGDNATVARRYAGELRVIAVESFQQALRALATLPEKAS
jgi:PDZ domain-containing protein